MMPSPTGQNGLLEQRRQARVEAVDGDAQPEDAGAAAPVLLGDAQARQAGFDEQGEEVVGVLPAVVDLSGARGDTLLRQLADGGLELGELVRELEIHSR